jgi:hypothetical protein
MNHFFSFVLVVWVKEEVEFLSMDFPVFKFELIGWGCLMG